MAKLNERYTVRRKFDDYNIGDVYEPQGHKNEAFIIEYYCDTEILDGVCPRCGKKFKRLDMHKCQGRKK